MVITAGVIQTVLSINYVYMDVVISQWVTYIATTMCNALQDMSVVIINAMNVDLQAHLQ